MMISTRCSTGRESLDDVQRGASQALDPAREVASGGHQETARADPRSSSCDLGWRKTEA